MADLLQLSAMSLLLTVWHDAGDHQAVDQFLGEVLLDLASADVRGNLVWFDLQEHDLNCSSNPVPSPKFARSSQGGAVGPPSLSVLRSVSMSRQSSRDSSSRSTASPETTGTNCTTGLGSPTGIAFD